MSVGEYIYVSLGVVLGFTVERCIHQPACLSMYLKAEEISLLISKDLEYHIMF